MRKNLRFVGLDVHKDSISVAVAENGREPRNYWKQFQPMACGCFRCWSVLVRRLAYGCATRRGQPVIASRDSSRRKAFVAWW